LDLDLTNAGAERGPSSAVLLNLTVGLAPLDLQLGKFSLETFYLGSRDFKLLGEPLILFTNGRRLAVLNVQSNDGRLQQFAPRLQLADMGAGRVFIVFQHGLSGQKVFDAVAQPVALFAKRLYALARAGNIRLQPIALASEVQNVPLKLVVLALDSLEVGKGGSVSPKGSTVRPFEPRVVGGSENREQTLSIAAAFRAVRRIVG
jgi:hypothetical protein